MLALWSIELSCSYHLIYIKKLFFNQNKITKLYSKIIQNNFFINYLKNKDIK